MQELPCDSESAAGRPVPGAHVQSANPDGVAEAALQTVDSEQLFRGGRVLHIQHEGALYQLRLTKLGKLILTK